MTAEEKIVIDDRCAAVHGPTGEQCLRGLHVGLHVGRGPVEWTDGGDGAGRGKKERKQGDGPVFMEFRYRSDGTALGYFWGPGREKEGLAGKPAHFGVDENNDA
jgi:hypothetical protein